ncbi:MAG: hypothetical protein ACOYWZ_04340 [Bacillota bacterium]
MMLESVGHLPIEKPGLSQLEYVVMAFLKGRVEKSTYINYDKTEGRFEVSAPLHISVGLSRI